MSHDNTLWFTTKILIVQSTEKRLICLKIQVFQTARIKTLTSQATVLTLQTARIKALTSQATVARIQATALTKATTALTALTTAVAANKY